MVNGNMNEIILLVTVKILQKIPLQVNCFLSLFTEVVLLFNHLNSSSFGCAISSTIKHICTDLWNPKKKEFSNAHLGKKIELSQ